MTPFEYCQDKVQHSGSSFLAGFRFLSTQKQEAMIVLYAYCRELDDIVDNGSDIQVVKTTLAWWRNDMAKAFTDILPEHPVNQALQSIASHFSLPQIELEEIINGMEMDLYHARYQTFDDLQYYCYRVAGVVGRLIARILGFVDERTLVYAQTMGLALQLTNIIRDVGEDARLGRIYLPLDELQRFNVPENTILSAQASPEFTQLMRYQFERARQTYRQAMQILPKIDKKSQRVGQIMASIYYALLLEISRDGLDNVLRYKIRIPNPRKMRIALWCYFFGFKP